MATRIMHYVPNFLRGHHPGLAVMALTEVWERLAYYGMRAILVLFLVDTVQGFSLDPEYAAAIYGLFLSVAYMTSLLGGWFGDRVLGSAYAIVAGSIFLIAGNGVLAFAPTPNVFYFGLFLIVLGLSLLKPNISAIISFLYPEGGARRDTAFYIFFLSINFGALIGPFLTAGVAAIYGFRAGFACAAIGMACGLIQLIFALRNGVVTGDLGRHAPKKISVATKAAIAASVAGALAVSYVLLFGGVSISIDTIMNAISILLLIFAVGYFAFLFTRAGLTPEEKKGVGGLLILFLGATVFYMGYSQPGSSWNLFTLEYTDRMIGDFEIPTGWFQGINPAFTFILTPLIAGLWVRLDAHGKNPPVIAKFGVALLCLASSFAIIGFAALSAADGALASPIWIVLTYLIQTCSEIILIPIGLSFVTKLMPARYVGQGMGVWFLSVSIGYLLGGRFAGAIDYSSAGAMAGPFLIFAGVLAAAAVCLFIVLRPARPLFANVE